MNNRITTLELCAGAGGLALGLEKAGLEVKTLVEIDKACCNTLKLNRPNWKVSCADMCNLSFSDKSFDVVTGGVPCQPFSYAGKQLGFEDDRGNLVFQFARIIKETQPKLFLLENVKGLTTHNLGETLKSIIRLFEDLGYCLQYSVLNSVNYQVPQVRERLIIVGTLPLLKYKFPIIIPGLVNLKDALNNVPFSEGVTYSKYKEGIMSLVPEGGNWKSLPLDIQKEYMKGSYNSGGGKTGIARRLSWDKPCLTLTTSPCQKQTERCHPTETRPLTIKEYARVQTFPDDWQFSGSITSQYKQIGNAVPVNLAYHLGQSIIECLGNLK